MKDINKEELAEYEYSMGNGQCPVCGGSEPYVRWWTRTIGHKEECLLARLIENNGFEVVWEIENPERDV